MIDDQRFDGRNVLVTGAGGGIGAASAHRFAALGASVLVTDLDTRRAMKVAHEIVEAGGAAVGMRLDVGASADWSDAADAIHEAFGPVSVIHNNAFTRVLKPAHLTSDDEFDLQLRVNVGAIHRSLRTFVDDLRTGHGNIVNTGSVHADLAFKDHPGYAASKGATIALTQQLAVEYGPDIRVNAVLPGPIETGAWDGIDDGPRREAARGTALLRMGRVDEVAAAVTFLASDAASYITAASLRVDGGYTTRKVLAE